MLRQQTCECDMTNTLLRRFYKNITLVLFFILPSKIANTFVSLSILAIIYDIRKIDFCKDKINTDKIHKLLQVTISDDILLLPNYTLSWFWSEDFLNSKTVIDNKLYTIKELIVDSNLFFSHMRTIIDLFIQHMPNSLKIKLGVNKPKNRIMVKHNIMNILMYS